MLFKPIDILGWIANVIGIVSFVPQCWKVYKTNDTKSLSLMMYIFINISFVLWIIYGAVIKAPPVMGGNVVMLILASYILVKKLINYSKDSKENYVNYNQYYNINQD